MPKANASLIAITLGAAFMFRWLASVVLIVLAGSCAATADTNDNPFQVLNSPYMRPYGRTDAPYAFIEFCVRMPEECKAGTGKHSRVAGTAAQLFELDLVNRKVNREIEPATDMELYGVEDYWTIPITKGDCEDYALLKRQILIRAGWPVGALLMTVVLDEQGEGHAVLTARTEAGDYILDNKVNVLKVWHQTPYKFVMRQSYINPEIWLSLDPERAAASGPVAAPRPPR